MIAAEYGWSDETIMNLTIRRLRQIVANITERRKADFQRQGKLTEWQTRSLAAMIASTAQTDKNGSRQLAKQVDAIKFHTNDESPDDGNSSSPDSQMTDEEIEEQLEHGSASAAEKNAQTGVLDRLVARATPDN